MREIKFRLWDKKEKKFYYFDLRKIGGQEYGWLVFDGKNYLDYVNPLMQYTGLKDKNRVEIYEGDIVKTEFGILQTTITASGVWYGDYKVTEVKDNEVEVIGNIYEDKELLK